jgi:acyl-CoA thioesterase
MRPSDLAEATAVRKLAHAPGWYVAELNDDWSYLSPSGGVLMTVAMRAMAAELGDPSYRPTSATTLFCSPVPAGKLEVRVEVLRQGNAAAQLRAELSSTDRPGPGLEVSATFARDRRGPDSYGIEPPDAPAPDRGVAAGRAISSDARPMMRPFFENLDIKLAIGEPLWLDAWSAGEARMAFWYRYLVPQRDAAGRFDPLAIPPIADTMPSALVRKLGPDHPRFYAPSLDLTVHFLDPSEAEWFLVDVRCRRARVGYATANADIWDDAGKLVATATQTMMLRSRPKALDAKPPQPAEAAGTAPSPEHK